MNSSISEITADSLNKENTDNSEDNSVSIKSDANTTVRSVYSYDNDKLPFGIRRLDKKVYIISAVLGLAVLSVICAVIFIGQASSVYSVTEEEAAQKTDTEVKDTSTQKQNEKIHFTKTSYKTSVGNTITLSYGYVSSDGKTNQKKSKPKATYSSKNVNVAIVNQSGQVTGVSAGATSINVVSENGTYDTVPVTVAPLKENKIKNVPFIYQGEKYPSGCESVSSVMLLNYYGFNIKVETFIDKYLEKGDLKFDKNGEMYGPDCYSAFLGNPYSGDALGCYPPVIEKAMNKYLSDKGYRAVDLTGASMEYLVNRYITNNKPVVIWATMYMANPVQTYTWKVKGADKSSPYKDGDTCEWLANEHCMLLTGYDKDYYYLHDPLDSTHTAYEKQIFEERFAQMGRCAVVIDKII